MDASYLSHLSRTPDSYRIRRDSKPSPPDRDYFKKQNTMSSPNLQNIDNFANMIDPNAQHGSQILVNSPNYQHIPPPTPGVGTPPPTLPGVTTSPPTQGVASFALQPADMANIVEQLKSVLREELGTAIRTFLKSEIDSCVKETLQSVRHEIDFLKLENAKLKADIDAQEQYSRRELVRVSGISESEGEDTTDIVKSIVKSIDPELEQGDIIRSHRVGNPNRKQQFGTPKPRQIIVRLKDNTTKKRILKASKNLKQEEKFKYVHINEDLTKTRNALAYRARQLKKKNYISQTWTVDGKIFLKDRNDRVVSITTDHALTNYISDSFPSALDLVYPPPPGSDTSHRPVSYAAAVANPGN